MTKDYIEIEWKDLLGSIRLLKKYKNDLQDRLDVTMYKAGLILKLEIYELITEIAKNNPKREKNNPDKFKEAPRGALIDTGFYRENWDIVVRKKLDSRETHVFTDTFYADWLDEYSDRNFGYQVTEKAWLRAKPKIMKLLENEIVDFDKIYN